VLFNNLAKRLLDIVVSLWAILFLLPFWFVIAILIRLDSVGPALYLHTRVGQNGKDFLCWKFRTMKTDADPHKLAESKTDDRITRLGEFLRRTSLDETLQLINVFLGDMSIVGPRPALPIQVQHFSDEEMWKLKVKPGLTGWTQVNGRNSLTYEKRMEFDVWYAKHHNFWLDLQIIFRTFSVLFARDGIYDKNSSSPT